MLAGICRAYNLKPAEVKAMPSLEVAELAGAIPPPPAEKRPADEVSLEEEWRQAWEGIPDE